MVTRRAKPARGDPCEQGREAARSERDRPVRAGDWRLLTPTRFAPMNPQLMVMPYRSVLACGEGEAQLRGCTHASVARRELRLFTLH